MAAADLFLGVAGDRVSGHSPADSTTYHWGRFNGIDPGTSYRAGDALPIGTAGRIVAAVVRLTAGSPGSSETFSLWLRTNDTTDTLISSSLTLDAAINSTTVTGLGLNLVRGDTVTVKMTTPAWVTNPTGVTYSLALHLVPALFVQSPRPSPSTIVTIA